MDQDLCSCSLLAAKNNWLPGVSSVYLRTSGAERSAPKPSMPVYSLPARAKSSSGFALARLKGLRACSRVEGSQPYDLDFGFRVEGPQVKNNALRLRLEI